MYMVEKSKEGTSRVRNNGNSVLNTPYLVTHQRNQVTHSIGRNLDGEHGFGFFSTHETSG